MSKRSPKHTTLDQLPRISQKLTLRCHNCRLQATYNVGTIFYAPSEAAESAMGDYAFTNYFRCRDCGSAGPWEIADFLKMTALALRAKVDPTYKGLIGGRSAVFDGTFIQTPAMGEDYLLKLIEKEPGKAFLYGRLGNLLRGCGQESKAAEWYEKALSLDSGDVEARYHLFMFAVEAEDVPNAILQVRPLVEHLLEGRQTNKDELTAGLALSVVDCIFNSPQAFQDYFLCPSGRASTCKEDIFIRSLLVQEGIEEEILEDAAERLLNGIVSPVAQREDAEEDFEMTHTNLTTSLAAVVQDARLNPDNLTVALKSGRPGHIEVGNRHSILVYDGEKVGTWHVPSLRELFRGTRQPPADMDHYPKEYCPYFYFIEEHFLTFCAGNGDRTDQEMEEVYSALRRRPDGRSVGKTHDFMWQIAALLLGKYELSEAEFDALLGTLVRSTRKWAQRPVSRNYTAYLRKTFEGET